MPQVPENQLNRTTVHERERDWPDEIRVVAQWTLPNGKRKATHFILTRDEYFGLGSHGAPLNGDRLMHRIETLRRTKP